MKVLILIMLISVSSQDKMHENLNFAKQAPRNTLESSGEFWNAKAQNFIKSQLSQKLTNNKAKNLILFVGDGLSLATVAAARAYIGREQVELSFEKFPHFGFAKTYCLNYQVADSACTATAFFSGVKGNIRTVGVNGNVEMADCEINEDDYTEPITSWAQKSGKSTGIVTTTTVTNATPAGAYAHTSLRLWESNEIVERACKGKGNVRDVAHQLVHGNIGKNLKVVLGGGRGHFTNTTELDEEGRPGHRTDGRNLIDEWMTEKSKKGKADFIWHNQQLKEIDPGKTDYLLGLFERDHCLYHLDVKKNNLEYQEASLTDMTVKAIQILSKEEKGFFLFVEGGRIDHGHHMNTAHRALEETVEFARAIEAARQMTYEGDTLIVVTSDHSQGLTYGGYSERGNDLLGLTGTRDLDIKPFFTLSYHIGPGYSTAFNSRERANLTNKDSYHPEFRYPSTIPTDSGKHTGDDVGIYASGPGSHHFVGSMEQNNIPLLMAFSAQIGPYSVGDKQDNESAAASYLVSSLWLLQISLFISLEHLASV